MKQKYINGLKEKNFSRSCGCNSESQCWDTSLRCPRLQILIKPSWTSCFVASSRRARSWLLWLKFFLSPALCSHLCLLCSLGVVPWANQTWKIYWGVLLELGLSTGWKPGRVGTGIFNPIPMFKISSDKLYILKDRIISTWLLRGISLVSLN